MSNTILIKRSGTASAVPASGNLALGELAINYADGNLFYKDGSNQVKVIASNQFVSVAGNVTAGNVLTNGLISAQGNVTGNYILGNGALLTGVITSVANINNGTSNVTVVSSGGNVTVGIGGTSNVAVFATSGVYVTGAISASGNITGDYFIGNGSQLTGLAAGTANSALALINGTTNLTTATNGEANLTIGGTSNVVVWSADGQLVTGLISASGNVTASSLLTGGFISATGNVTAGNISTTGSGGNISGANVISGATLSATVDVIGGNVLTGGLVSATGNITSAANIAGGNLSTAGQVSATGNVTSGNVLTGGLISATSTITSSANITGGNLLTGGLISATSTITSSANITGGNVLTGGLISATSTITSSANITGGNVLTGGLVSASSNVTGGNINTGGLITASGNITGGNVLTGGLISATGNIYGNVGAITTVNSTTVSATGNVTGSNVIASTGLYTANITSNDGLTLVTSSNGNINLQPNGTGNVVLSNTYVNGVAYPAQDQDAASKIYVDNMVSTALTYHEAVVAATTTTLAAATGGTISYAQPNGAGNGVGATLTTTGAFLLIDTANVQTVGTRILVKDEANAVFNGVYTYANTTTIVRSTDADQYGPASAEQISINDYFFVSSGNVNAGSAWVVDAPDGTITFGTSNITFAQFSSSQTYTANTAAGISLNGTVINAKVDNDTTAFDGGGNITVKASANLTTPNIGAATGTSLSVTGTVTAGNVNAGSGFVSTTGNITGGNILTGGLISATSSITSGANITGGNILTGGLISATGNINGGNLIVTNVTGTLLTNAQPNITSVGVLDALLVANTILADGIQARTGSDFTVSANGTNKNVVLSPTGSGIVSTAAAISAGGNVTGANILTSGLISAGGNITGGNILFGSGIVSGTGNIYGGNIFQASNQVLDTTSTIDGGTY